MTNMEFISYFKNNYSEQIDKYGTGIGTAMLGEYTFNVSRNANGYFTVASDVFKTNGMRNATKVSSDHISCVIYEKMYKILVK